MIVFSCEKWNVDMMQDKTTNQLAMQSRELNKVACIAMRAGVRDDQHQTGEGEGEGESMLTI